MLPLCSKLGNGSDEARGHEDGHEAEYQKAPHRHPVIMLHTEPSLETTSEAKYEYRAI